METGSLAQAQKPQGGVGGSLAMLEQYQRKIGALEDHLRDRERQLQVALRRSDSLALGLRGGGGGGAGGGSYGGRARRTGRVGGPGGHEALLSLLHLQQASRDDGGGTLQEELGSKLRDNYFCVCREL